MKNSEKSRQGPLNQTKPNQTLSDHVVAVELIFRAERQTKRHFSQFWLFDSFIDSLIHSFVDPFIHRKK